MTIQSSIGKPTAEVVFGHQLVLSPDLVDTTTPIVAQEFSELWQEAKQVISGAQQCQTGYVHAHCKYISFEPRDFVLLFKKHLPLMLPGSCKLKPLWVNPYQIVDACSDNVYELELPAMLAKFHPVFNATLLERYIGDVETALDPIKLDNGPDYEVYAILCHQLVGWQHIHLEYFVSFAGCDASHNEWLPVVNLTNAPDTLHSYQNFHELA